MDTEFRNSTKEVIGFQILTKFEKLISLVDSNIASMVCSLLKKVSKFVKVSCFSLSPQ